MHRTLSFFFIIFFYGMIGIFVGNLTLENSNFTKNEVRPDIKIENKELLAEKISEFELPENFVDKNIKTLHDKEIKKNSNVLVDNNLFSKKNHANDTIIENNLKKANSESIKKNEKAGNIYYIIQFGAFSRDLGLLKIKKEIDFKIKKKFKEFNLELISEKNNLYKLIYRIKDEKIAQKICKYSKEINIDCYVKKKQI